MQRSSFPVFSFRSSTVSGLVVVQLLSYVRLFATPWAAAYQASLSLTIFQSLPKFMSVELVMPSNHLILCSGLTFKYLIHVDFTSVYGAIEGSNFILLHVDIHFPQHHLLKILSFLHVYS